MVQRILYRNASSEPIARADDEAELGFVIKSLAGTKGRRGRIGRLRLAVRPHDRGARHHDRRAAAVVADRHPLVIGQQRVVRPQHLAHVGSVMDAGEEVAVIADVDRQEELCLLHRQQVFREPLVAFLRRQSSRKLPAQALPATAAQGSDPVQRRPGLDGERGEIEDLVADGHAAARRFARSFALEDAERQVLDREVAPRRVRRLDPAFQPGIMRGIEGHRRFFLNPSQIRS